METVTPTTALEFFIENWDSISLLIALVASIIGLVVSQQRGKQNGSDLVAAIEAFGKQTEQTMDRMLNTFREIDEKRTDTVMGVVKDMSRQLSESIPASARGDKTIEAINSAIQKIDGAYEGDVQPPLFEDLVKELMARLTSSDELVIPDENDGKG